MYGQFFILFQSFVRNKIIEVFVLDTDTKKTYFKAFICNSSKYPKITPESADMYGKQLISNKLYQNSTTAKVKFNTTEFELLLLYALNDEYQSLEAQGKRTSTIFRDMDIYLNNNNYIEISLSRYNDSTIYLILLPIDDKKIEEHLLHELASHLFKAQINYLHRNDQIIDNKLNNISEKITKTDKRMINVDIRMLNIDNRLNYIDNRITHIDNKMNIINDNVLLLCKKIDELNSQTITNVPNQINIVRNLQ